MADHRRKKPGLARRIVSNPVGAVGALLLSLVVALAVAAPWLYPDGPYEMVGPPFSRPFGEYLLGTDMLGRDIAAGIAYGAQISLLVGAVATIVIVLLGTVVG
ncbi:ABC transporter permease, partial [Streptomyces sp. DH17]|nr:ABC transporter permease [Streptomyces sp. DH17]